MNLTFERLDQLPRLSWCAVVRRGGDVLVRHGRDVETRPEGFVEGAWDGDFDAFDFDRAQHLVGSGGVLRGDACIFAAPFHPLERLYVVRGAERTIVSNSFVFAMEAAGEDLDLAHPNYFFDLMQMARRGIARQPTRLRTAAGRSIELYTACRLRIDADLTLRREPMPVGPPPADFAELFALLDSTVKAVLRNAADPARQRTYSPVAACSRGYDSTAAATLAARAGCTEGVTFARSGQPAGHPLFKLTKDPGNDSGRRTLEALGMNVTERDRLDFFQLPGHPKAEFFFRPLASTDASEAVMEDKLAGGVFFTGRHAERYWGPTTRCKRRDYREVDDVNLSGHAYGEFRLRAGFIHFPATYIGALHGPALYRITHSDEMRPWKLGVGYYDRPIARRIAEEAGVPREFFGHQKFGTSEKAHELGPQSEADFQQFFQDHAPAEIRRRLDPRPIAERHTSHYRLAYFRTQYSHLPLVSPLLDILQTERMHRLWNSTYLYVFHWGFEKTRERYRLENRG